MFGKTKSLSAALLLAAIIAVCATSSAVAQGAIWRVAKASGDVWVIVTGAQPVALTPDVDVKPGNTIRTGANGRALLSRGAESMLISANSVVTLPDGRRDGMSTTILQQAGSILLDVEKRNVQHFSVETPYLAAVVKGTQFRVSVDNNSGRVEVLRGQVQVADFRSGQWALVNPNQVAHVSAQGAAGLSLSGSGELGLIQQGMPRTSTVRPIIVPKGGLSAPDVLPNGRTVPMRQAEWVPSDGFESGWAAKLAAQFGLTGQKTRTEQVTMIMAIPLAAGVSAAVGAAAWRRRKKKQQEKQQPPDNH